MATPTTLEDVIVGLRRDSKLSANIAQAKAIEQDREALKAKAQTIAGMRTAAGAVESAALQRIAETLDQSDFESAISAVTRRAAIDVILGSPGKFGYLTINAPAQIFSNRYPDTGKLGREILEAIVPRLRKAWADSQDADLTASKSAGLEPSRSARTNTLAELVKSTESGRSLGSALNAIEKLNL